MPDLPIQYADFAAWQARNLSGERLAGRLDYWRRQLDGMPPYLEVPTDRPRPEVQATRGANAFASLPDDLSESLQQLCRRQSVTLFMLGAALFQCQLRHYSGQVDVALGSNFAGREHLETEGLIGFFINQLVLRVNLAGNPSFQEILQRVRETVLEACRREVPFETLVEALQPERDRSRSMLFQHKFEFLERPASDASLESVQVQLLGSLQPAARYDTQLTLRKDGHLLSLVLLYDADLFEAATARQMLSDFQSLAEAAASHPEIELDSLGEVMARNRQESEARQEEEYQDLLSSFRKVRREPLSK